jgi:hypothetical protein
MPDVRNALKFQKKLTDIESTYIKQVNAYRTDSRRVMLDIIDRHGVSRPAVTLMQKEVDSLAHGISLLAGAASKEVSKTVSDYTRKQVEVAHKVGLAKTADIASVLRLGEPAVKDGRESYMTNTSAWIGQLSTSLQVQSARLRLSNASSEEIAARLLSEKMADGRASVWAASGTSAQSEETSNVWSYGIGLLGAYLALYNKTQPEVLYQKQAIATIDERTTSCCLQVHGQIQDMDEPFRLTGTPRYADEVQDPPFHYYCRSSEVLYHEEFENIGITTEEMTTAAQEELDAREATGTRDTIYPSHATSRRS